MKNVLLLFLQALFMAGVVAQVNPQTGSAAYSMPLFNWQDNDSRLKAAVAISYQSGNGLKVTDVASNIGQGWNLIAGGSVTRMTVGQPDDQKPKDGPPDDLTKYPAGYLYDEFEASQGCPGGMTKYPIYPHQNQLYKQHNAYAADKELDQFAFQINGRSGMFVLGKNNGDKGVLIGDTKLKVWYTRNENAILSNLRTTINAFYIQDENGLIYKFSEIEKTKVLRSTYSDETGTFPIVAPEFKMGGIYHEADLDDHPDLSYVVNTWHLSEIRDPFTHRSILFTYEGRNIDAKTGITIALNFSSSVKRDMSFLNSLPGNPSYYESYYMVLSHGRSIVEAKVLKDISFPDGHMVNFNYGERRIDLNGDKALASIDVLYQDRFLSKYLINTAYFYGNRIGLPATEYQKASARLCLKSIQKVTADLQSIEPPHSFEYYTGSGNTGDIVPAPFSNIRDIWGYYNANYSKDYLGFDFSVLTQTTALNFLQLRGLCYHRVNQNNIVINVKPGAAKNGLLKQITYPAGGSMIYEYDDNRAFINNELIYSGGVHVSRISVKDGGYSYDCNANTVITDYEYVLENSTQPSLWGVEMPSNFIKASSYYKPEKKKYKFPIFGGCGILGCCKYKYTYPGLLSREQMMDISKLQLLQTISDIMTVVSIASDLISVISVIANAAASNIATLAFSIILSLYTLFTTCFSDMSKTTTIIVWYQSNLKAFNSLPSQFSRVVIRESSGPPIGKTVMEFTSPSDYPIWEPNNPLRSMKQRYAPWAYGLLKRKAVINKDEQLINEQINVYEFSKAKRGTAEVYNESGIPVNIPIDYTSCKCQVEKTFSQRSDHWSNPDLDPNSFVTQNINGQPLKAELYQVQTGRVQLEKTVERQYMVSGTNVSNQAVEKVTEYEYGSPTLQPVKVSTTQSNGKKAIEYVKYSGDTYQYGSNQGNILKSLILNNVLTVPVDVVSTAEITNVSQPGEKILHEAVTQFQMTANGDIKPSVIQEKRYQSPSTNFQTSAIYQGPLSAGNPAYKSKQKFTYDNEGRVINVKDEGGRQVSSIYDYDGKYVVATIINADMVDYKDDCAYSSFETSGLGGWNLVGSASYEDNAGVTGKRAFHVSANAKLKANVSWPNPYMLTFWSNTNSIEINNNGNPVTLIKSGPVVNGMTYYEYELEHVGGFVQIEGTGIIDELRLYPKSARMKTTTFDVLYGKTSDCDENNRITYYEYDNYGRLWQVKDEQHNILKMYDYYIAKNHTNTACPPPSNLVYQNVEMSEPFRRNDCGKDYIGTEVIYTVQAGTYTSTVSQEVADQLAQNDINQNGQNWANSSASGSQCVYVFRNTPQQGTFTKENCGYGYVGGTYVYNVPADRYTSLISVQDANQRALDEIAANGQAYANMPGNATCIVTTEEQWEYTGVEQCNGTHIMYQEQNMNPNSSTYGAQQWTDGGESPTCGGPAPPTVNVTYINRASDHATLDLLNITTGSRLIQQLDASTNTAQIIASVPPGDYEITISLPFGNNATSITVLGQSQSGSMFHLNSISITASGNPTITINN